MHSRTKTFAFPPTGAVQVAERLRLAAALASLKPEWRSVVLVVGIGGLSYEETAAALHIPIGTVQLALFVSARTQLAASLADSGEKNVTGDLVLVP